MEQRIGAALAAMALIAGLAGCNQRPAERPAADTTHTTAVTTDTTRMPVPPSDSTASALDADAVPLTLPVLDAFFADSSFSADLKSRLGLTDQQVTQLRTTAREETAKLNETQRDDYSGSAEQARTVAAERIKGIIGEEKTGQLAAYLRERWGGTGTAAAGDTTLPGLSPGINAVPTDTRIVVNAPAYRMDIFQDGKLTKSYKVGIGYPEFPLPTGTLRFAKSVIFNPTWTPPDEPWVEGSSKVQAGKTVPAGSSLNPLGPIKIPIGLPSLIHGGKAPSRIGNFASHGCVGLTDPQIKDVAMRIGTLGGTEISDTAMAGYLKKKTQTKEMALTRPVPVELRYETIVVEDGVLHIYRDVYDRNTNTQENLYRVLAAYGITPEQLSESEGAQAMDALREMSRDPQGRLDSAAAISAATGAATAPDTAKKMPATGKVTRNVKGAREVAIPIAALRGKGYPAPVGLDPSGMEKRIAGAAGLNGARR